MTKLDEIAAALDCSHVYIQTHDFPDPDAIASAFGLQVLLKTRGISSTICYKGLIDRYSTAKMVQLLGIQLNNLERLEEIDVLEESDEVILVDSQKGNANIVDMTGDEVICIDHHPVTTDIFSYRVKDIRPEYGACATIIAEYFFENNIPITKELATAFTYAIRVDTNGLLRGVCKKDIEILSEIYDLTDYSIIKSLENSVVYREDLKMFAEAMENIAIYDNVSFAHVGGGCPETLIAQICDFMLELVEVDFSVVYSVKSGGVKLSIRSTNPKLDAGKIVRKALKGIGNGGGHAEMAGGFMPLPEGRHDESEISLVIRDMFLGVMHLSGKQTV